MTTNRVLIVMGVSAVGKSTIARALADRIGGIYLDADDYHPAENLAAMAAGRPLDDAMREPWLAALVIACDEARRTAPVVLACSALKRSYRDVLQEGLGEVTFVHATASRSALEERISARAGHYMPASLLQSQLEALEPPAADEAVVTVDAERPIDDIVDRLVIAL